MFCMVFYVVYLSFHFTHIIGIVCIKFKVIQLYYTAWAWLAPLLFPNLCSTFLYLYMNDWWRLSCHFGYTVHVCRPFISNKRECGNWWRNWNDKADSQPPWFQEPTMHQTIKWHGSLKGQIPYDSDLGNEVWRKLDLNHPLWTVWDLLGACLTLTVQFGRYVTLIK